MKSFIKVYNRFFSEECKLSINELYLYAYLSRNSIQFKDKWSTVTNIYLIDDCLKINIGTKRKSKEKILSMLLSLKEKGFIICDVNEDTKNSDTLYIDFVDEKGYSEIKYELFDVADDAFKFYIYCYIDCFGDKGRRVSDQEWMELTGVSRKTVRDKISEMNCEDAKLRIYKFSGDYVDGDKKQEKNLYYTRPDEELIRKWSNFYGKKDKGVRKINDGKIFDPFHGEVSVEEYIDVIRMSNWGKEDSDKWSISKYKRLKMDDYYVYRVCKDYGIYNEFVRNCERIVDWIKGRFNYDGQFERWEDEYIKEMNDGLGEVG